MSTRRDKFTNKDRYFMNLALNLAKERVGLTGTNPSVGCIITKDDKIINIGQTGINGRPHAEFSAIMQSKKKLTGSTLYVSLEPCTHYGKTPPCTNLIIKSKIKKVIFSILDVDERTYSKSFTVLKAKKIIVKSGLLKEKGKKIYKDYIYCKTKKMPFVTGKIAISKDNFIYSKKKLRITNKNSDKITHLLRYQNDSILISSKTLNSDNPKLNCRINGLQKFSPKRIILDRMLSIRFNSNIILTNKKNNTIIFYNKGNKKKIMKLKKKGIKLIKLPVKNNKFFDLNLVLKKIYLLGTRNLLVEGGMHLTNNFLKNKLFNKFYLYKGSYKLGSDGKINISNTLKNLNLLYKRKSNINSFTGSDIINIYSN